jgi:hypothetical protein
MIFSAPRFCARLAAGVALAALSAAAQPNIQFSKPVDQETAKKDNSFMRSDSELRRAAGGFNAPSPLFNLGPVQAFDRLPGAAAPRAASPEDSRKWQKILEGKKNWTLMTPEEILGVQTPEQILGIPDPKNDDKLTPEERFLQRQERLSSAAATNSYRRPDAYLRDDRSNPFRQPGAGDPFARPGANLDSTSPKYFGQPLNASSDSPFGAKDKQASEWSNPFNLPPSPKATPEQLAGMERFRALMEPAAVLEKPASAARPAMVAAAPDPYLEALPNLNPAGHTFTSPQRNIGKPSGIKPLPGITGPYPAPAARTAAQSQLPPWLSDSATPFSVPQRKF